MLGSALLGSALLGSALLGSALLGSALLGSAVLGSAVLDVALALLCSSHELLTKSVGCAALLSARSSPVAQAGIRPLSAHFELLKRHLRLAEWPVTTKSGRAQGLAAHRLPERNHIRMVGYEGAAQGHPR